MSTLVGVWGVWNDVKFGRVSACGDVKGGMGLFATLASMLHTVLVAGSSPANLDEGFMADLLRDMCLIVAFFLSGDH